MSRRFKDTLADTIGVEIRFSDFDEGVIMAGKLFGVEHDLHGLVLDAVVSRGGRLVDCLPREYFGPVGTKMMSMWVEELFVSLPDAEVDVNQEWFQKLLWEPAKANEPTLSGNMSYRLVKLRSTTLGTVAKIEGQGSFQMNWVWRQRRVHLRVKREEKYDVVIDTGRIIRGKIWDDYSWGDGDLSGTRRFEFQLAPQSQH